MFTETKMQVSLTQLQVLVIGQDEDDVRPDVAAVSLEAGLQTLARGEMGGAERHGNDQKIEESARHGHRPLTSWKVEQSLVESQILENKTKKDNSGR